MKIKSKLIVLFLLTLSFNLNAQSKLNNLQQNVGELLSELIPIKFKYTLLNDNDVEKKSSLVSYQIMDTDVQSKNFFKIKGTFIVDLTDVFTPNNSNPINKENLIFKFEATGKQILDKYVVINIIYFDEHIQSNSTWKELYNNE